MNIILDQTFFHHKRINQIFIIDFLGYRYIFNKFYTFIKLSSCESFISRIKIKFFK